MRFHAQWWTALALTSLCSTASAQVSTPNQNRDAVSALRGERKLQYLARQLALSEEQAATYDQLIGEVYRTTLRDQVDQTPQRSEMIRALMERIQAARKEGDQTTEAALQKELARLSPVKRAESEFLDAVRQQLLKPEQVQRLDAALARLERNPSGELLPVDVLRLARELKLDETQRGRILQLRSDFRAHTGSAEKPPTEEQKRQALEQLVRNVRAVLTEAQAAEFDQQIAALRPESVPEIEERIALPARQEEVGDGG